MLREDWWGVWAVQVDAGRLGEPVGQVGAVAGWARPSGDGPAGASSAAFLAEEVKTLLEAVMEHPAG